jgi:hypothetical protein
MKKLTVLLLMINGTALLVACNGGSSSSSGGGGSNSPSGCPNGAVSCGATESATSVSLTIPLGALNTTGVNASLSTSESPIINTIGNLTISNQESSTIYFSVESNGYTQPFIMDFTFNSATSSVLPKFTATTSQGQNPNQCRFPDNSGSYVCTLTISPNGAPVGQYTIKGSILNGSQPFEINVVSNILESSTITLPPGTYLNNSIYVARSSDSINNCLDPTYLPAQTEDPGATVVVTGGRIYSCGKKVWDSGVPECLKGGVVTPVPTPSYSTGDEMFFNIMWKQNTVSLNNLYTGDACYGSGLIPSTIFTYISASETLPYPVVDPYPVVNP